jgi:hypothetical protein
MIDREEFEAAYVARMNTQTIHFKTGMRDYTVDEIKAMRDGENYTVVGFQNSYLNGCWWGWQAARATPADRDSVIEACAMVCERIVLEEGQSAIGHGAYLCRKYIRGLKSINPDSAELGPYEFDVKLGEQMYVDSSMQYRNGTVNLTIKRKPRESVAAIESQRSGDGS